MIGEAIVCSPPCTSRRKPSTPARSPTRNGRASRRRSISRRRSSARAEASRRTASATSATATRPQARLEEALAAIDSGAAALAFASGMAAATALLQSLPAGSHVMLPDDSYYGVRASGQRLPPAWGLTLRLRGDGRPRRRRARDARRDARDLGESPSNPLMKIADVAALARDRARARRAPHRRRRRSPRRRCSARSSTAPTSSCTPPPSTSAATATCRAASLAFAQRDATSDSGRALPQDHRRRRVAVQLLARPARHPLARRRACACTARTRWPSRAFLASHPRVEAVHYPGLSRIPATTSPRSRCRAFGGMLSFIVRGGREDGARRHRQDEDLHPRHVPRRHGEPDRAPRLERRPGQRTPENLLRLSVGLEDPRTTSSKTLTPGARR